MSTSILAPLCLDNVVERLAGRSFLHGDEAAVWITVRNGLGAGDTGLAADFLRSFQDLGPAGHALATEITLHLRMCSDAVGGCAAFLFARFFFRPPRNFKIGSNPFQNSREGAGRALPNPEPRHAGPHNRSRAFACRPSLADVLPHHLLCRSPCLRDGPRWEAQAAAGCSSGCCSASNFRHSASAGCRFTDGSAFQQWLS